MLWKKVIGQTLKTLAMARRDTELIFNVPREEIDRFIVKQFGELMEKYNSMDKEELNVEHVRFQKESKELVAQELKELLRGANLWRERRILSATERNLEPIEILKKPKGISRISSSRYLTRRSIIAKFSERQTLTKRRLQRYLCSI